MLVNQLHIGARLRSPSGAAYRITDRAPFRDAGPEWWATPEDGGRRVRITSRHLSGDRTWTVLRDYRRPEPGRDDLPADLAAALANAVPPGIEWDAKVSTRARRTGLLLDEHTRLQITVPATMTPDQAAADVAESAQAIRKAVYERHPGGAPCPTGPTVKAMVGGEDFAWLGQPARLRTTATPGAQPAARIRDGHGSWVQVRQDLDAAARAAAIIALYKTEGAQWARERATAYLPRLGIDTAPSIEVVDRPLPRHRWCQYYPRTNTIRLWWPLFQMNVSLVDFVITLALWESRKGAPHRVSLSTAAGRDTREAFAELARQGRGMWDGAHRSD